MPQFLQSVFIHQTCTIGNAVQLGIMDGYDLSYTIFSIFMMLTLLCGTVMLVINLYNGNYFEPIVHTMAVFMIIGSIIAFVSATIIRVRRKMVNKD